MNYPSKKPHPQGERLQSKALTSNPRIPVDTYAGRVQVEWDSEAAVTPMGQLSFFIEFLKTTKLFDGLVGDCPLELKSNNASKVRDVLGSMVLSILSGHTRYSHVTALRGESVNADLLGMKKMVSEDVIRRMLLKMDEEAGINWLEKHLKKCYEHLLTLPWILDLDASVKPLYGKQEAAEVGYNPQKPGRPSHTYHSYFIANIRMVLNVDVQSGKNISGSYSMPRLWKLLDSLPKEQQPKFIRGDISYGTDRIISEAESRELGFLFKLKCTFRVKDVIKRNMERRYRWEKAGHGFEGIEDEVQLTGWDYPRRVIILRRKVNRDIGILSRNKKTKQLSFQFAEIDPKVGAYEYSVLVTNLDDEVMTLATHYRDRGDSENNFDELKNQWGWGGFTTHDLKRCKLIARFIALIYDWWTIFMRLVDQDTHREAITSRPLILNAVGKLTTHGRQKILTITSSHAKTEKIKKALSTISTFLHSLQRTAEQFTSTTILKKVLEAAFRKFFEARGNSPPKTLLLGT